MERAHAASPVSGPVAEATPGSMQGSNLILDLQRQAGNGAVSRLLVQRWEDAQAAQQVVDALPGATEEQLRRMLSTLDTVQDGKVYVEIPSAGVTLPVNIADGTELRKQVSWRLAERRMEALAQARRPIVAAGAAAAHDTERRVLTDQLLAIDGPILTEIRALTTGRSNRFAHPDAAVTDAVLAALQLDAVAHAMAQLGEQGSAHATAAGTAGMGMEHDWCGFFAGQHLIQAGLDRDLRAGLFHVDNVSMFFQYLWAERNPRWIWVEDEWKDVREFHTTRGSNRQWHGGAALGDIRPGDVLLVDTDGNGAANHIVLVHSYNPLTRKVFTIGGNDGGMVLADPANPQPAPTPLIEGREAATGYDLAPPTGLPGGHVGVGEHNTAERRAGHSQVFGVGRPSIVDMEEHSYNNATVRPTLPPGAPAPRPRTPAAH